MFSWKINILHFVFLNIIVIHSLVELPAVEDNDLAKTEVAIRSIVNNLFSIFKSQDDHKPRLKHLHTIHNFFVSISLTDFDNLKQIARLSRVNDIDNNTQEFITKINEILNEGDMNKETNTDELQVTEYINSFIKQLKHMKTTYTSNRNVDVNEDILKYTNDDQLTSIPISFIDGNFSMTNDSEPNILDSNEFWRSSGRRIYHGSRTRIRTYPFLASVQFFNKFQCAGSIIKNNLVITSASCLQLSWNNRFFRENPAFLTVQVGSDFYEGGGENIPVSEINFHPHYDPKVLNNNLAIMRLSRKINFKGSKVKKIDFDKNPWTLPENTGKITVIGWGARSENNIVYNPIRNKLSYADLSLYPLKYCQDHYTSEFVTMKNFCAGFVSKGGGACNRDAGGPGVVDNTLMGVISFGSPTCGAPDAPTVFTKLGYYSDWITNIMQQDAPYARQPTTKKFTTTVPPLTLRTPKAKLSFLPLVFKRKRTTQKPIPIKYVDALRLQNLDFKDIISKMFGSDEYFSINDTEITQLMNTTQEETDMSSNEKAIDLNKDKSETGPDSMQMSTRNLPIDEVGSVDTVIRKNEITKSVSNNSDTSLEKDIMRLIANLDLRELEEPEVEFDGKSDPNKDNDVERVLSEFSNESKEDKLQLNLKQQSLLDFLLLSQESNEKGNVYGNVGGGGLSIEESFHDLTYRNKRNVI